MEAAISAPVEPRVAVRTEPSGKVMRMSFASSADTGVAPVAHRFSKGREIGCGPAPSQGMERAWGNAFRTCSTVKSAIVFA